MALTERIFDLSIVDENTRTLRVVASTKQPVENTVWDHDADEPVEVIEALESWDLRRFLDNPIVLFQHDEYGDPIGLAQDVEETEDGLEMTIVFASAAANPEIDKLWNQVRQGLLRKVSVGFDYGERTDEERDGRTVRVYRNNELLEVSMVRVPKDAGAGTVDRSARRAVELQPDGTIQETGKRPGAGRQSELSAAGRKLASARRSDADEDDVVQRFDVYGTTGRVEQTSAGGIRVPARLTRTGVLEYKQPDGTVRRELRLPEEVFHADALNSLRSAPVTDLQHHRGFIDPTNWRQAALGHAENIRADGDFVEADLVINDPTAIADVLNGRLREISLGYGCKIEAKSGTHNGKRYDFIQRRIRNNHVAILPPGRARAGSDVSIRLDSNDPTDAVCVGGTDMKLIKIGNREVEYGSEEHIGILTNETKELQARFDAREKEHADEIAKLKKEQDEAQARFDALETEKKGVEQKLEEATKPEAIADKVRNRVSLVSVARDAIGNDDETTKRFDAMTDRDLMVEVIKSQVEGFDAADKSDDYVRARFDALVPNVQRMDGVDSVVRASEAAKKRIGEGGDEAKARAEQRERDAKRWQEPVGFSLSK